MMRIGLLHPGAMGSALATQMGAGVLWAGAGRSEKTRERAELAGMRDVGSVSALVEQSDVIFSVCPPAAASEVARSVEDHGFSGVYVDANAIAPSTAKEIAHGFTHFVDGGIVGPPPSETATCRLYLSGLRAGEIAELFTGSQVTPRVVGEDPGTASAVKVAYGTWSKGSTALLLAVAAYAHAAGVGSILTEEWEISIPGLAERLESTAGRVGQKAWRFSGEMEEAASAFLDFELPAGFQESAAEVFRRLSGLKDLGGGQSVEAVIDLISQAERAQKIT